MEGAKFSLKTYSRTKNRERKNDAVFTENALQSLKQNIFSPDDKTPASNKGERKRQRSTSTLPQHGSLKKLKQGKSKKVTEQAKIQRRPSYNFDSQRQDTSQDDVLFGEDLQLVKTRKKSNVKRQLRDKTMPKQGAKGGQKRGPARKTTSRDQNKTYEFKSKNAVQEETGTAMVSVTTLQESPAGLDKNELPPGVEIGSEDKVSDWLARSDKNKSQHEDSNKEIWRQEQQCTGDEVRNKLFPDEFFENLNKVLQKPELRATKTNKHAKDKFLSQLFLKSLDEPVASEPQTTETENSIGCSDDEDDDVTFMYTDDQSGTQTGTQTETGSQPFTTSSVTSKYTETQSQSHTGFSRKSKNQSTEESAVTDLLTEELTPTRTDTNGQKYIDTQTDPPSQGFQSSTKSPKVSGSGRSTSEVKEQTQTEASELEQTIFRRDVRVQKYLCSTMRRSASTSNVYFPSELSSVTDSLKTKQQDERTPRRTSEEFKVPVSPTKCAAFKGVRKGILQPKNSTKLFTSGFVEIVDAIPQMSTILNEPGHQNFSPEKMTSYMEKEVPVRNKQQNIKTSTPNKVNSKEQAFVFEIDISSVNMDSDEDELLHFRESREVNSEECIHLSDTLIDIQQDGTIAANNTGPQSSKKAKKISSGQNEELCIAANIASLKTKKKKAIMSEKSLLTLDGPKVNSKVSIRSKQTRKNISKILPQESLGNKSVSKNLASVSSGLSMQLINSRNSSRKLSRNIHSPCDIINDSEQSLVEQKKSKNTDISRPDDIQQDDCNMNEVATVVPSAKIVSDYKKNIYDIDESANNAPSPHSQIWARKQKLLTKKLKYEKSLRDNNEKIKKNIHKKSSKRNSSEIYFDPKGPLNFTFSGYSAIEGTDDSHEPLAKNGDSGSGKHGFSGGGRNVSVPICTLNDQFTCPKGSGSVFKYKTGDTRSRQEVLNSVTIDVLMW